MGCEANSTALPSSGLNGKDGVDGQNGINGKDVVNAILSNEIYVFSASNAGTVLSYTGSGTAIRVFYGTTALNYDGTGTSNGTWKITASATNITVGTFNDDGSYVTIGEHSAVANGTDTSKIVYTITGITNAGDAFTIIKEQNFSKAKVGSTGSTGAVKGRVLYNNANVESMIAYPGFAKMGTKEYLLQGATGNPTIALENAGDTLEITASFRTAQSSNAATNGSYKLIVNGISIYWNFTRGYENYAKITANITRIDATHVYIDVFGYNANSNTAPSGPQRVSGSIVAAYSSYSTSLNNLDSGTNMIEVYGDTSGGGVSIGCLNLCVKLFKI